MEAFYREAFNGKPLSEAVTRARQSLTLDKHRDAYFGLQVELEDWMLPVFYENEGVQLQVQATAAEERATLERLAGFFKARPLKHRFYGRDLDVLSIERRVLSAADRNILLIEGMGGTGKTTLLQHLGWWWQVTGLVSRVFNFEYDHKPWTRQQILFEIARQLGLWLPPNEQLAQEAVAKRLRSERFLLVLDNLESVTGEQLAIGQSLSEAERGFLLEFLGKLRGGKTLVLVGSRSKEQWLAAGTFDANVHPLRGLDREARSSFGDEVLRAAGADPSKIRAIPEYRELLELLGGHPLAMQVILSNLAVKSPAEVLTALPTATSGWIRARPARTALSNASTTRTAICRRTRGIFCSALRRLRASSAWLLSTSTFNCFGSSRNCRPYHGTRCPTCLRRPSDGAW
jgi:hypothetical protein